MVDVRKLQFTIWLISTSGYSTEILYPRVNVQRLHMVPREHVLTRCERCEPVLHCVVELGRTLGNQSLLSHIQRPLVDGGNT